MLTIQIDKHFPLETSRETGLTVRGAVLRAYAKADLPPPSMRSGDDVKVNARTSMYDHILTSQEDNALVRILTVQYMNR